MPASASRTWRCVSSIASSRCSTANSASTRLPRPWNWPRSSAVASRSDAADLLRAFPGFVKRRVSADLHHPPAGDTHWYTPQGADMSNFDPNVPSGFLTITGEFTSAVLVTEVPAIGVGNLVLDPQQPFDIKVDWKIDGNIAELWLSALAVASPNWVVTAYAESIGPGPEQILVAKDVP